MDNKMKQNYLQSPLLCFDLDSNKRELIELKHECEKKEEIYYNELKHLVAMMEKNGITVEKNCFSNEECDTFFNEISKELKEIESRMNSFEMLVKESSIDACESKMLEYGNLKAKLSAFLEVAEIYSSLKNDESDLNLSTYYNSYATKLARIKHLIDVFNTRKEGALGKEFENQFIDKLEKELFEREDSFIIILKKQFRNLINYNKFTNNSTTTFELSIKKEKSFLENILSSMYQLDNLDIQMRDFVKFLKEIIENGVKFYLSSEQLSIEETDVNYLIKFVYNIKPTNTNLDVESKYDFFNVFFAKINMIFHDIVIDNSTNCKFTFLNFLGSKIGDDVVSLLKSEYLMPMLPYKIDNINDFDKTLKKGKNIIKLLQKDNFLKPKTDYLNDFINNLENLCIEKKCLKVSFDSKILLFTNMCNKKSIEITINEIKDIDVFTSISLTMDIKFDILQQMIVSLGKNQKYIISDNIEKMMDYINELTNDMDKVDDISKKVILRNSRNIIKMILILLPRIHKNEIDANFEIGALFYNNYFYILYHFFKFHLIENNKENINIVTKLRILANDVIKDHFHALVTEISRKLYGRSFNLKNDISLNYFSIFKNLPAFGLYLKREAKKLYELFPITMYNDIWTAIGKHSLECIAKIFMGISDFRSDQCELMIKNVNYLFVIFDEIFKKISPEESVKNRCFVEYYRLYEILFCLNHSLDEIAMRFCEEEYCSEFLEKCELKSLIRAIFQNTDKRAEILKRI
ncbi:Centromere/kinetochore protein zw10 homolog [Strongyloides ratti]|uniref:Centromere/kinetochore protein zw10 homolog n=1 Tax=Strongyloides ratti TaxID=34506 RepID=A0A090LIA9_STRRB|nr:Centromere/kinetochore protein zw10 homolog [Strongyloides ratti]CEF67878.1 Centromere/kinetochore protein zw10 homolog [Strongyloides ratti]